MKQLVESLPTAFRGLKSGKITPRKALLHPKLPDQENVRHIYKEVHDREERIELNLYIVSENPSEEEGAQGEGSMEN